MSDSMISLINKSIQPMAVSPVKPFFREESFTQPDDPMAVKRQKDNNLDRFEKSDRQTISLYNNKGKINNAKKNSGQAEKKNEVNEKKDGAHKDPDEKKLSKEEEQELEGLKKRDREVKAHEQAHIAAGGGQVRGGANFEYKKGPDGKNYASGGEVSIDASSGKTPEETIKKMAQVKAAALAPADPSDQDRRVAAQADAKAAEARAEMMKEKSGNQEEKAGDVPDTEENKKDQKNFKLKFGNMPPNTSNRTHEIASFNAYQKIQQDIPTQKASTAGPRLNVVA